MLAPGPAGGLESVVRALVVGQAGRGDRVTVLPILDGKPAGHPFVATLESSGIEVAARTIPPRNYRRERIEVEAVCRAVAPDVVHSHGYRCDVLASPVARRLDLPTVTTVHGFTGGDLKNRFYEWLQRRSFRHFAAVVAVSRPLVAGLIRAGVAPERVHLIPNAYSPCRALLGRVEARARLGVPAEGFRVGWVGRLSREKGPDVLLEALAMLRDLPIRASVVGGGREAQRLQERAGALGLLDRVHWHGVVGEMDRLYPAFDCFVLSSRTEGTPIVLFEAMAARVPIVATAVGGVPDVLGPAEAGLVPRDDPAGLADAVRRVYQDPAAAATRACAAAARLETEFAVAPWLDRYAAVYDLVATDRRTTP